MAQERGAFTIFDAKREEKNPFVLRIKEADSQLYADMQKYGRRNIACLTIAPNRNNFTYDTNYFGYRTSIYASLYTS